MKYAILFLSLFWILLTGCKKEESLKPETSSTDTVYIPPTGDTITYDYKLVYEFLECQVDYSIIGGDTIQYSYWVPIDLVQGQVYKFQFKTIKESPRYTYLDYRVTETASFGYSTLQGDIGTLNTFNFEAVGYSHHKLIITTDYPITILAINVFRKDKKYH